MHKLRKGSKCLAERLIQAMRTRRNSPDSLQAAMMALWEIIFYGSSELGNVNRNGRFFTPSCPLGFVMPVLGGYNVTDEVVRTPIRCFGRTQQ